MPYNTDTSYNHPPVGGLLNHNEMATIKEFKEWLNRFPEDTIIEVGIQGRAGNYEAYGAVNFETLKLEDNDYGYGWEFLDFRTNQFIKEDSTYFGKCYLRLGETS